MAKSFRGVGSNEDIDSDRLLDVIHGNGKTKEVGGLMGFVLRPFKDSATYANKLFEKELQRITKLGREQEKEMMANKILEKAREGYLKKQDKKLEIEIENAKKEAKRLDEEQKQADKAFKAKQAQDNANLKGLQLQLQNAKKEGKDTSKIDAQIKALQESMADDAKRKAMSDAGRKKAITKNAYDKAVLDERVDTDFKRYLRESGAYGQMEKLGVKVDDVIGDGNPIDAKVDAKNAYDLSQQEYKNTQYAIEHGLFSAKGSSGRMSFDSDDDDSELRRGKITPKTPTPVTPTTKAQAQQDALGALDPFAGGNAITASANTMQGNLARDLRDEDIAHRTEREALTDEYRQMVKENLEEQTYQLQTINENQHAIYELMQQGGGSGGGGIGLMDMMMGAMGAKGAGGLLSKGFNLVKGVGSKVALPLAIASSVFTGAKSGMDTDAIAAYTGKDPSEVGILDRIQYGGAGLLSGLTGGLIGTDTIANAGEAIGNFLFGKSDATIAREARLKEQQELAEFDAMMASREASVSTSGSSNIHNQILEKMGVEAQPQAQGQELAELNAGTGGGISNSVSNVTNNTTNVIPENPKFRINDSATLALSAQGL